MRRHRLLRATTKVRLPNARTILSFQKYRATRNDWVSWHDSEGQQRNGRVLGIIELERDGLQWSGERVLSVLTFGSDATFTMIRWVHPTQVTECQDIGEKQVRDFARMLSPEYGHAAALATWEHSASLQK